MLVGEMLEKEFKEEWSYAALLPVLPEHGAFLAYPLTISRLAKAQSSQIQIAMVED